MGKEQVNKFTWINKLIKICILNSRLVGTSHMLFRSMNTHGDLAYSISQMDQPHILAIEYIYLLLPELAFQEHNLRKAVL